MAPLIQQLIGETPDDNSHFASPNERTCWEENDDANGKRLLSRFGGDMVYTIGKGWGIWDGNRYYFEPGGEQGAPVAAQLADIVTEEIRALKLVPIAQSDVENRLSSELRKSRPGFAAPTDAEAALRRERLASLTKFRTRCGDNIKQVNALKAAQWRVKKEVLDFDSDPWLFVTKGGVIDLKSVWKARPLDGVEDPTPKQLAYWRRDWLKPPTRKGNPTKCAGAVFNAGASCPEWERFIALVVPDLEVRLCLQRCLGALLMGANPAQVALLLRGSVGNGKSTLMNILGEVLGTNGGYAVPCKVELFLQTGNQSAGQANPEEVDLPGARALLTSESAATDILSAKKIKALTGGDLRPIRALHLPQFTYRPSGIPVIQFNRTPKIKDEDEGTRRRLIFIPLEVNLRKLPEEQRRNPLEIEAALKSELSGILNWMLDGFRDFQERLNKGVGTPPGIDPPEAMQRLKDDLLRTADPVGEFLADCTVSQPSGKIRTSEFFKVFDVWLGESGAREYTKSTIREIMQGKDYSIHKSNGHHVFDDLAWADTDEVKGYRQRAE